MKPRDLADIIICTILINAACAEPVRPELKAYPLEITATENLGYVNLQWSKTPVTSFVEYVLYRSADTIPDVLQQPPLNPDILDLIHINDSDIHQFTDTMLTNESQIHYKVIARFDDRIVESRSLEVVRDITTIPYLAGQPLVDTTNNTLLGYDDAQNRLFMYNYRTGDIGGNIQFVFGKAALGQGTFDDHDEIYMATEDARMYIYRKPTFEFMGWMRIPSNCNAVEIVNAKIILTSSDGELVIIDRSTGLTIASHMIDVGDHKLHLLPQNAAGINFLVISEKSIRRFTLQNDNTVVQNGYLGIVELQSLTFESHPAQDELVIGESGLVVRGDLQDNMHLQTDIRHKSFAYSSDGNRLYSAGSNSQRSILSVFQRNGGYTFGGARWIGRLPTHMWCDESRLYGLIFFHGAATNRTMLIEYPTS